MGVDELGEGPKGMRAPVGEGSDLFFVGVKGEEAAHLVSSAPLKEILTDHPKRFRAMFVESANPAHSLSDSQRMREAILALDFVVAIDTAFRELCDAADRAGDEG